MKNKKKFLRTSISTLVVVATVLIAVVATIKYKEDYDEEKRFNDIRENVEKSSEEKILYNLKKKNKDIVGYIEIPNTTISYPVLQTTDEPDFYLNHDINRNYCLSLYFFLFYRQYSPIFPLFFFVLLCLKVRTLLYFSLHFQIFL